MNKEAFAGKDCTIPESHGRETFSQLLREDLPKITVCRADLISPAVEKETREALLLIDYFLTNIWLPDL